MGEIQYETWKIVELIITLFFLIFSSFKGGLFDEAPADKTADHIYEAVSGAGKSVKLNIIYLLPLFTSCPSFSP